MTKKFPREPQKSDKKKDRKKVLCERKPKRIDDIAAPCWHKSIINWPTESTIHKDVSKCMNVGYIKGIRILLDTFGYRLTEYRRNLLVWPFLWRQSALLCQQWIEPWLKSAFGSQWTFEAWIHSWMQLLYPDLTLNWSKNKSRIYSRIFSEYFQKVSKKYPK